MVIIATLANLVVDKGLEWTRFVCRIVYIWNETETKAGQSQMVGLRIMQLLIRVYLSCHEGRM